MDDDTNHDDVDAYSDWPINHVATHTVNVRESASTDSKIVSVLEQGQRVSVESISDGWAHTDSGHVKAEYLKEEDR